MERYITIVDYYQRQNNKHLFYDKHVTGCRKCPYPERQLVINRHGAAYICLSPAWLPKTIGSLLDYDDLFDLLNSYEARAIRSEISLGRYSYCNHTICDHLSIPEPGTLFNTEPSSTEDLKLLDESQFTEDSRTTRLPDDICFDFDYTCNFQCPSCRTEMINDNFTDTWAENKKLVDKIKHLIIDKYRETPLTLRWAGGEPFVSRAYLELWEYIVDTEANVKNIIQTNGSYLIKRGELLKKMLPYISRIRISFDAGSADTYQKIRVNGEWDNLLSNCKFIRDLIDQSGEHVVLQSDFVTQYSNYREIDQYVAIADQLGFDEIFISKMWNWGTWSSDEFKMYNITDPSHLEHKNLVTIINRIKNTKFIQTVI